MKEKSFQRLFSRVWTLLAFFLFIILWACQTEGPVKVGFIAGTSGRVADLGISGLDAVQLVVESYNREGGINGRRIELVVKDDRQDPETAKKVFQELVDDGVAAVIGPMTSDMAMSIVPLINEARLTCVSPTVTTQLLSGRDDYFFRVSSTTREYATKSASYHIKAKDMQRICAVYDLSNRSFCENWLENFKAYFTSHGGEIIATEGFDVQAKKTFMDFVRQLLAHEPDGILVIANSMDAALICQQVRKINSDIPITLADWGATERLLELGGKAVEGVTVIQTFDRDNPEPHYQEFRKTYLKQYGREPGFPGVYAHDAAYVVLTALQRQQKNQSLKETIMSQRTFEGLQSEFTFDDFGDVDRLNASISVVRDGKFVVIE